MHRAAAVLLWLALASAACRQAHAPTARRIGMVSSIAGVVGLMATAALQSYTTKTDDMLAGFSLLSAGGILLFAAGDLAAPESRRETETEKFRRWARILTSRAAGAAREGRCPRVRRLEKRVNVYDREVHDFVFMRDAAILRCLGDATPGVEPGAAEPASPLLLTDPSALPGAEPSAPSPDADPANQPPPTLLPPPRDRPDLRLPPGTVLPPTP
jgi:hypothetical protein